MSSEVINLTIDIPLPEEIKNHWIPLDGESVPHLLHLTQYPPKRTHYHHPHNLAQILHKEDVTNFNPNTLLTLGLLPVGLTEGYQAAIKATSHPTHTFTVVPFSGYPVNLSTCVLDYWREIRHAMGYQHDWKKQ